jgi:TonB family protein
VERGRPSGYLQVTVLVDEMPMSLLRIAKILALLLFVSSPTVAQISISSDTLQSGDDRAVAEEIVTHADVMPEPIGGLEGVQGRTRYPAEARRLGVQGTVMVRLVVDVDGAPRDVTVIRGVSPALDRAAADAILATRFLPGLIAGEPVPVIFSIPVRFRLNDPSHVRSRTPTRPPRRGPCLGRNC